MACVRCGIYIEPEAGVDLCTECFQYFIDEDIDYWIMVGIDIAYRADLDGQSIFWDAYFVESYVDENVRDGELIDYIWRNRLANTKTGC